ncbi:response regulator [Flavobacterium sp.]|uniref:response regulator n=1 Tax=Flavobacterium sp. TaxID=239 RepID=UPI00261A717D|nr:response regulator [Flavobacterium sp.]
MKAKKPSYDELENKVAELKEELVKLSLLVNESDAASKIVLDNLGIEKSVELKSLNSTLIESVLNKVKTPLDTIVGLSKLLSTAKLDFEEKNNLAEIISNCSNEIQGVFSEFVSYNALKFDKGTVDAQKVSLNELLDDLKVKFVDQVFYKGLNFRSVKGLSDDDDTVLTDGGKLTQVFTSLLNNSLKFTNKGYIEMGYRQLNGELKFYVKDSGVGLDKSFKEKLSASALKIDKVSEDSNEVGLGLSTVKRYVELLGGSLNVESEPGVGTVFSFKVPYVPAVVDTEEVVAKKAIKVLIADDEEISFILLKKLMEKGDVQVIRAKNGEEAYEIYKKNPDINLILMDLRMPQVDGYVAAQLIKNEAPEIPIIAQSAFSLKDDKANYGKAFNGYLSKPVNKKDFELAVNKYIDVTFLN